ncbi:hypothetical protein CEXT_182251 [Caerostris extrusa]|uniref:RNase H type-1 domain-containing protein n=1 Tax=Caerostris extrusa TaxID=172846 RepID=A0AAV4N209_CAEEX|nr:hypothetical protein CEXT_182251 [Caerostris extrusa]
MSFLQWNCRSLQNKKIWLHQPPFTTSEFWVFQETFLKADDRLSFPNKIFFRTHRNNRTGGGLLIGIPPNMSGHVIFENSNDPNLEMLAVEIQSHNVTFTIVNIYAPHGFDIHQVQNFFSTLKTRTFIFGDFNLHHPFWGGKTSTPKSEEFLDWLNQSHFSILNTSTPTHITHNFTSSVIDLTLCSAALLNEVYCYVSDCTFESDHLPIVVSWSKLTNATKYLKTIYWNPILRDSNNFLQSIADPTVEIVTEKISHTININTKNKILTNNEYPPWWNIACNNFCQLKKIMWKKARNSVSVPDWIRYKKYRNKIKRLALQFLIKQYANHSFSPLMVNNELQLLDKDENTLKNSLQNYNCSPEHLLTLPIVPRHDPPLCEIFLQKFRFQNKENPVSLIVNDFSDCINRFFSDHYIIATDASKSHVSTSIAGISCNQSFSYRINPINSVFTAEVLAICVAIDELAIVDKDILILSDSFSALNSLKNLNIHSTYAIQRLASKLFVRQTFNQNITFLWVPGHSEILWNEKADSLAKNTTELSQFIEWISPEDVIANLKNNPT